MKRWLFREPPAGSPPRGLARELSISPLLLDILWRRGLDSPEELDAYLSARLPDLVPPSRWPQFPQAAEVISKALLDGKKLAVWGDYDVDGITSSTLVLDVLEAHGLDALWHVPDRRSEGYGLNIPAIEELAAQGCGILPRHVRPKAGQTLPQRGIFPAQKRTPLPCRTRALRRALPSTMVSTPAASRAAPETICKMPMAFFIKIPSPAYS